MRHNSIHAALPVTISLTDCGKKFHAEWIFKNLSLIIEPQSKRVILGGNGSGKSTLLQCISTAIGLNKGSITYHANQSLIAKDQVQRYISLASPYLQLIEEFTLPELIAHIAPFKPFLNNMPLPQVLDTIGLAKVQTKYIRQYSSGMKQRVKLALAILANCPVLLLDEPISNLDKAAITWYQQLMKTHAENKTVLICSNSIEAEYEGIAETLEMEKYK